MKTVEPMARSLEELDRRITDLNHEVDELKSEREALNQEIVAIVQEHGIETTLGLAGGGTLKLYTDIYPQIKNMVALEAWAKEAKILLPVFTINPKTMQAWYREQMENSKPIPPDEIVSAYTKTKAKVLKK